MAVHESPCLTGPETARHFSGASLGAVVAYLGSRDCAWVN
jgi:hypothetical protein